MRTRNFIPLRQNKNPYEQDGIGLLVLTITNLLLTKMTSFSPFFYQSRSYLLSPRFVFCRICLEEPSQLFPVKLTRNEIDRSSVYSGFKYRSALRDRFVFGQIYNKLTSNLTLTPVSILTLNLLGCVSIELIMLLNSIT